MGTYKQFDVVVVPFPFTDRATTKKRPALIVSDTQVMNNDKSVMAMITTANHAPWPLDISITDLASTGLKAISIVRFKLFTLDNNFIVRKIGNLSQSDRNKVQEAMTQLFKI